MSDVTGVIAAPGARDLPDSVPGSLAKVHGVRADSVIEAIDERRARRLGGDHVSDGRRLGLVIEGGGLRGVASAAGAVVLAQLGLSDVFDEVYATSAAVMNASYFLTNQPLLGISVYFDNCTTKQFVNPWRFWKIVDVDYIFDYVVVKEKPLDLPRLAASPSRLYVPVIDRSRAEPRLIDVKASPSPLTAMKASAALPVFYNRAVLVDGAPCMDGGLAIPIALEAALASGCTHVLVFSTRPHDYVNEPPSWWSRFVFNALCARGNPALNRLFREQYLRARESRALATGKVAVPPHVHIATVCTTGVENVDRIWATPVQLREAALSYGRKVLSLFVSKPLDWTLPEHCASAGERMITL
jgi:predicted patatin/cPLA2 family phospholipase